MPPKPELPELNVKDDPDVKAAYRNYTSWIGRIGLRAGATQVFKKCGSKGDGKATVNDILLHIKGLEDILPVYLEGIVALCNEERGDRTPLGWWRKFVTQTLKPTWFATVYPRLPRASMDLRKHDEEYYLMDDQEWAKIAAAHILTLDYMMDSLLATQGTEEERELMQKDIAVDKKETLRHESVYQTVAEHRLGADQENNDMALSVQQVSEMFADEHVDCNHYLSHGVVRRAANRVADLTAAEEAKTMNDGVQKLMLKQLMLQIKLTNAMRFDLEAVRGGHALLKRDLEKGHLDIYSGSTNSRGNVPKAEEPAWWSACLPAVYALSEKKGMKFESKGITESTSQKKGRVVRDEIYNQYASLWDEDGYTWTKIPEESKIAIANACGKAPMLWSPSLTAKRLTNYIAFRRSDKGKAQLAKQKSAAAKDRKNSQSNKVSHIVCTLLTLCAHYACIHMKCALSITSCNNVYIMWT